VSRRECEMVMREMVKVGRVFIGRKDTNVVSNHYGESKIV